MPSPAVIWSPSGRHAAERRRAGVPTTPALRGLACLRRVPHRGAFVTWSAGANVGASVWPSTSDPEKVVPPEPSGLVGAVAKPLALTQIGCF